MRLVIVLLLLFFSSLVVNAQESAYKKQWLEIDTLIAFTNQTKTALDKIKSLQQKAKEQGAHADYIRSLLYQITLEERITEKNINDEIAIWEKQIQLSTNLIEQSILHCLAANAYNSYFSRNQWRINNRSKTENTVEKDILTWASDDFSKKIIFHYQKALAPATELQNETISKWMPLISKGNYPELRPTLYDLIAHEALDYFKVPNRFSKDLLARDSLALTLFQQLIEFHTKTKNRVALLDVDLERIQWLYQKNPNADTNYINALTQLQKSFNNLPEADAVYAALAEFYFNKANNYQPLGDTSHRWDKQKAKKIIEDRLRSFPTNKTGGRYRMEDILANINHSSIHVETEGVNIPEKPFRAFVKFKNIDTLYIRVIRTTKEINKALEKRENYNYWKTITSLQPEREWEQIFPNSGDYQFHGTEIKIPALALGHYYLLFSKHKSFDSANNVLASAYVQVSNLSVVNAGTDYFVLHRETGKPIANAQATAAYSYWNSNQQKQTEEKYTTNKNGQFTIKRFENNGVNVSIKYKKDSLTAGYSYIYRTYYSDDIESTEVDAENQWGKSMIHYFKDRAIYRPGQTVFFKGIIISRNGKTGYPIPVDKTANKKSKITILLKDANDKTIDTCKAVVNAFGSFNGKFTLPMNVLTGEFRLEADAENDQGATFRVEEYKRPTYAVSINKPKGNIQLGDSIAFTGLAKAYAGNAVDGASIRYTITRTTRTNIWGRYYRPRNEESVQLKQGETRTDGEGKFSIDFTALPDTALDKATISHFTFTVDLTITDTKGETKEAQSSIAIGYQPLQLSINTPEIIEKESLQHFFVYSKNQLGDDLPAHLKITIDALASNERLTRKRLWEQPDVYVMNKAEFIKDFPIDDYDGSENDKTKWKVLSSILSDSINTGKTNKVFFPKQGIHQGWYLITLIGKDKNGKEVVEKKYIQIFDRKATTLPTPTYHWRYTIKNTVEPGDTASYMEATGSRKAFVIQYKNKDKANKRFKKQYSFYELGDGKKENNFEVTEQDRGGFSIHSIFVKDSRVYTNSFPVSVPWSNKELNIAIHSFRDKTEPGSKEKWQVKISGKKGAEYAAELLTSMYDASLDAFVTNNWQSPNIWPNHYSGSEFGSLQNFTALGANLFSIEPRIYPYNLVIHNRLVLKPAEFWNKLKLPFKIRDEMMQGRAAGVRVQQDGEVLNEVVVTGYAMQNKKSVSANTDQIAIRGANSLPASSNPLYVIDGAVNQGMVLNTTKNGSTKPKDAPIQIRKNFDETAFFYPEIYADSNGVYSFEFTMPESVTEWKWQLLAHTKDLSFGSLQQKAVTQKTLMVQTNVPRFIREGDRIEIVSKISNTGDAELTGQATLELIDAQTNKPVDGWFQNIFPTQYFTAEANQSTTVRFPVTIPYTYNKPLLWRVSARSSNYSDGEQNILPVLSNRMLVTESLPLILSNRSTKDFRFEKLLTNKSESLSHESVTVEYTSNPIWTVVQALPYLMEYPYECAEQTFNRYYANSIAASIVQQHPQIKTVFNKWAKDSSALKSNLAKNEELKQILLQETPWVFASENETEQRKNIAQLFDLVKMSSQKESVLDKLQQLQLPNGAFSWFKGGREDFYMTNYIVTGFGKLQHLKAITIEGSLKEMLNKAIQYLDNKVLTDYTDYLQNTKLTPSYGYAFQYLYMRSFFAEVALKDKSAWQYYYNEAIKNWNKQSLYYQSIIGLTALRNQDINFAKTKILPSIIQNAVEDSMMGMYWKDNTTTYWYKNPIEFQSSMIGFCYELNQSIKNEQLNKQLQQMQLWLLLQKQSTDWKTTIATADACYAVLLNQKEQLNDQPKTRIRLGKQVIESDKENATAGTGYFKKRFNASLIDHDMGNISVTTTSSTGKPTTNLSYGAVYWQYFEDLDKITPASTPLSLEKKLFVEKITATGKVISALQDNDEVKIGDKLVVRIILRSNRDMEYLHLKDMRASGTEPVNVLSEYKWQDGLGYYEATKDASTNFFISYLPKGTYVFEYPLFVTHSGTFSVGIANIQCMYAPEFVSHSAGISLRVGGQ